MPVISFPQPSIATVTTSIIISTTTAPATTTTVAIDPNISFILTLSTLVVTSVPTTLANSLTNPDQATAAGPATTLITAPLPSNLPARIFPRNQLDPNTDLTGYTFIGILFDQDLNWPFVVNSPDSSTQIFAYVPIIIATALGISGTQILTWALQVYIPTTYHTPADAAQLGTMWLGYVPSNLVSTLSQEILAKQSKFYTGASDVVAKALASHVNSGFSILSVSDPNSGKSGGTKGTTSASDDGEKTRQNAIIGVVSALAAIALLILVILVYRMIKRRRELEHRRLSDPPDMDPAGVRPEGQDFDQDSVGGARRRSFYYAEDSLRGFQGERRDESVPIAGPSMTQRRIVPGTPISAPILRESSLNW
ncbi:hypothetical protein BYT27DRAFT_7261214 [Phlegmacium glaucopus]|nr:hypothetical protein BYT27DRAFT_7261214 [Phlegmacium glaucopus]